VWSESSWRLERDNLVAGGGEAGGGGWEFAINWDERQIWSAQQLKRHCVRRRRWVRIFAYVDKPPPQTYMLDANGLGDNPREWALGERVPYPS